MKVCIAEKPSVAREIASVLGATTKKNGYFEGNGYQVTYTFGHLCTLWEPHDYKPQWKSWSLDNLPMSPDKFQTKVSNFKGIQTQFDIVKTLFDKAEVIINCGDAGQEGELIQRWVINQAGYKGKVERLWISSLTTEAIKDGFKNLKPASDYDNLYYAGFSRAICDWLLGMNATRLYTIKHGGHKQVLSVGRVQTPTLAMVVRRFLEIENFKPQPFWELQTLYRGTQFNCEEGRFLKKEDGEVLAKKVKESDFEITSIVKKKGKEYAPKLFDLTGLQVYANNKFGFTADETLKVVQTLYEQKAVTYPRVDTTFLPNDVYPKVEGILKDLSQYGTIIQPLLGKKIKKSKRVFDDKKVTDHHAIIPTGQQIGMDDRQKKLYNIITRRFIAAFYDDCQVSNTTVKGQAAKVSFKTTGKEILEPGWKVVFETKNSNVNEEDSEGNTGKNSKKILPTFTKGEAGAHQPSFLEKQTSPPKIYSEATLLRAMETAGKHVDDDDLREAMKENGIGRPSTRANIIETLFKRKYIKRNKKQILPTQIGIQLIATIKNDILKSAEMTGQWERKLKEIEKGEFPAGAFVNNMKKMVDRLVFQVRSENTWANISHENIANGVTTKSPKPKTSNKKGITSLSCPKCKNGTILQGKSAYGCSSFKNGCDFILPFSFMGKKISENQFTRLIKKGATVKLKGFKTASGKADGIIEFDQTFKLKLVTIGDKSTSKPIAVTDKPYCPKCNTGSIIKGKTAYGCSNFKSGCNFVFPFDEIKKKANGKTLTKELVIAILIGK